MSTTTSSADLLPKTKLSAVSRFKQFAGDRLGLKSAPKIVFPPPSWEINDISNPSLSTQSQPIASDTAIHPEELPEPTTFALKIRQMIEALPLPTAVTAAIGMGHVEQATSTPAPVDDKGPPVPENVDPDTMRMLSSEDIMNGHINSSDQDHGVQRQSVWSALEEMGSGSQPAAETAARVYGPPPIHPDLRHPEHHEKGVMLYSPLEPTADSEVQIAASKEVGPATNPVLSTMVTEWVPSTTQISVLTTWWGYRLYLPPPVMRTLDSNQLKATQRAAMITTALTWFLKKVPSMMIPGPMMPTVKFLRRLSPLLSYIGVFIAWSWGRITACDSGNGVVLSATWLLPVALIPMAWDAGDIYGPPNRPPTPQGPASDPEEGGDNKNKGKEKEKNRKSKR
ncbi:hypothetical protein H0H93_005786 [Arthromyces matolae]|nr:hypothetical protein H0H93_005786 [Arthromyces matolae]